MLSTTITTARTRRIGRKESATSGEHDRDAGDGQRQDPSAVAERRTGAGRGLVTISRPGVGRARFLAVRSLANVARCRLYRFVEGSGPSRCEQNTHDEPVNPRSPPFSGPSPAHTHKSFLADR